MLKRFPTHVNGKWQTIPVHILAGNVADYMSWGYVLTMQLVVPKLARRRPCVGDTKLMMSMCLCGLVSTSMFPVFFLGKERCNYNRIIIYCEATVTIDGGHNGATRHYNQ
jgi:hypothetical protein